MTLGDAYYRITASGYVTIMGSKTIQGVCANFLLIQELIRTQIPDLEIKNFSVFQVMTTGNFGYTVDLEQFSVLTGAEFEPEIGFGVRYRKVENGKRFIICV